MYATLYRPLSEDYPTFWKAKITDITTIISYNYKKRFYSVGEFTMEIPINEPAVPFVTVDTLLFTNDGDYLYITDLSETAKTLTIHGYDLKYLLSMRVTLFPETEQAKGAYGYYVVKGSTEKCISEIVDYNISEQAPDPNRRIRGLRTGLNLDRGIPDDRYMTRLESLDEVVGTLCKNANLGYEIEPIMVYNTFLFKVVAPTDRSDNQNKVSKVVFSEQFFNATDLMRQTGVSSLKNALYTVNNGNYDSYVQLVNRDGTESKGFLRKETALSVNCDIDDIRSYALKNAEDKVKSDSFKMEVQAVESYKKDWFIGDIVTFKYGSLQLDSSIIEVEVDRTGDSCRIKITAGENNPTVIERMNNNIKKNSKKSSDNILDKRVIKKTEQGSASIGNNNQLDGNASTSVFVGSWNNVPEGNSVSNSAIIGSINNGYSMSGSLVSGVGNSINGSFSQSALFGITNRISASSLASAVFGSNNSINESISYSLVSGADIEADTGFSGCLISGYNIKLSKKNNVNSTLYNCQIFGSAHKIEGVQTDNSEIRNCLIIGTGVEINPIKSGFRKWLFLIGGGTAASPKTIAAVDSNGNIYANSYKTWDSINTTSSTSSNSDELSDMKSEIELLKQRVSSLEQQFNK